MNELQTPTGIGVITAILAALWKLLPVLVRIFSELRQLRELREAEIEQQKRRDRRRRREASIPPPTRGPSKMPSVDIAREEFDEEESTDIDICLETVRTRETKRPRGERPPRPGTHHDGKER